MSKKKTLSCAAVFGMILAGGLLTVCSEKESFSELENRYLAKFPAVRASNYFSGDLCDGIEEYLSDHFFMREDMVKVKNNIDILIGKDEINGIYILENRLAEHIEEPDESTDNRSVDSINAFAEGFKKPVFMMLIPTQAEIYREELPKGAPNPDQKAYIDSVTSRVRNVTPIDVYSVLKGQSSDYIYYRTDHHWTTKGAYCAYQTAARKMGYEYLPDSDFDRFHSSEEFRGTFYSKTLWDKTEPDTIDIYLPSDRGTRSEAKVLIYQETSGEPEIHQGMYYYEYLEKKDKYSVFFGTNQPMVTIKTDAPGGKLLVLKDSYAHSLVPFLAEHYSEITMLDTRYIQVPVNEVIDPEDYDQALLVYNVSTFMDGVRIRYKQ